MINHPQKESTRDRDNWRVYLLGIIYNSFLKCSSCGGAILIYGWLLANNWLIWGFRLWLIKRPLDVIFWWAKNMRHDQSFQQLLNYQDQPPKKVNERRIGNHPPAHQSLDLGGRLNHLGLFENGVPKLSIVHPHFSPVNEPFWGIHNSWTNPTISYCMGQNLVPL